MEKDPTMRSGEVLDDKIELTSNNKKKRRVAKFISAKITKWLSKPETTPNLDERGAGEETTGISSRLAQMLSYKRYENQEDTKPAIEGGAEARGGSRLVRILREFRHILASSTRAATNNVEKLPNVDKIPNEERKTQTTREAARIETINTKKEVDVDAQQHNERRSEVHTEISKGSNTVRLYSQGENTRPSDNSKEFKELKREIKQNEKDIAEFDKEVANLQNEKRQKENELSPQNPQTTYYEESRKTIEEEKPLPSSVDTQPEPHIGVAGKEKKETSNNSRTDSEQTKPEAETISQNKQIPTTEIAKTPETKAPSNADLSKKEVANNYTEAAREYNRPTPEAKTAEIETPENLQRGLKKIVKPMSEGAGSVSTDRGSEVSDKSPVHMISGRGKITLETKVEVILAVTLVVLLFVAVILLAKALTS